MTLIMLLTLIFHIGPTDEALRSPYPFVHMFSTALQSVPATTAFTTIMLVLLAMVTVSAVASTSRQTFAFARDNGLPFSRHLSQIHPRLHLPLNAILLTAGTTTFLSLINLASTTAFTAILSLSTTALMASYILTLACITLKRLRLLFLHLHLQHHQSNEGNLRRPDHHHPHHHHHNHHHHLEAEAETETDLPTPS
ncbi:hypothetical protein B0A50_00468 [Salinomyces thailandicus]|uniref:Amino acid permease/ SLC12A domain-containing protein n=1 Tax=Salinomyces thailandicus TaxID=706561 RepID=A0A4U0UFF2_9PEZI|nr:hypothetical protein B0A50_00468 [Salinomyces thailandica]